MQIRPEQLTQRLDQNLSPCYLISGNEPLITQECADAVRIAARARGCTERKVIEVTNANAWQQLQQSARTRSLFSDQKLIELRLPSGKPGREGSKAIQEYLNLDSDNIFLIVSGKIDKQSQRAKWYTAFDKVGVIVAVWPIAQQDLPQWLNQRLKNAGLHIDREALQILSERVEGNLLAAAQEAEKLKLLATDGKISIKTVMESVLDNARYSTFGLADTALEGDARAAIRTLRGLKAEATQPPLVLWALARDINLLAQLDEDLSSGISINQALNQRGVWRNRVSLIKDALNRQTPASIEQLQSLAFKVDSAIKGFQLGDPWDFLDQIVILLAQGHRASTN